MRKKLYTTILSLCFLMMYSCSTEPSVPKGEYLIQGKLLNVPDSVKILLRIFDGRLFRQVAKDTIIDGEFMFRDTITTGIRWLSLMGLSEGFPIAPINIWVSSGKLIKITGENNLMVTWNIESDLPEQKEEDDFIRSSFPESKEVLKLQAKIKDLRRKAYYKNTTKEFKDKHLDQIDSILELGKTFHEIIAKKELIYLEKAPISNIWMRHFLFNHAKMLKYDKNLSNKRKEVYTRMSEADRQTDVGKEISSYMNLPKELNVGDDMVDGDLYDLEGKVHHLSEFKGKYIMLNFWNMHASPCIQSIPELEEISELYKDKLAVVSINMNTKKRWQEFIADEKITGFQWNELRRGWGAWTGLAVSYKLKDLPHYVLISPDGKVQDIWSGYGKGSLKTKLKDL